MVDLRITSTEYVKLFEKVADLKKKHPFIDAIPEESGGITLSAEEHAAFVECMSLTKKMEDMERQHIYFRGHTDAFAYLKEIKAF